MGKDERNSDDPGTGGESKSVIAQVVRNARRSLVGVVFWVGGRFSAMLMVAAALSPGEFGQFAVTMSVVMAIERSCNVQSWQLVTRFSADATGANSLRHLRSAFRAALAFDVASAMITVSIVYFVASRFSSGLGLHSVALSTIVAFGFVAFLNSQGAFTGVLRATDQFAKYAAYQVAFGICIVAAIGLTWALADLRTAATFIYAWLGIELACFLVLMSFALAEVAKSASYPENGIDQPHVSFLRTWKFAAATLTNSSLRMITKEWDIVILSSMGGATVAGMYKLAKQISTLPLLVSDQFYFAIFPKIAQLWSAGSVSEVRGLIRKVSVWSLGSAAVLVLGFFVVIQLVRASLEFGEYDLVLLLIQYCLPSVFVAFATFVFAPALVATGNHAWQVLSLAAATLFFLLSYFLLESTFEVAAMPIALFSYFSVWAILAAAKIRKFGGI